MDLQSHRFVIKRSLLGGSVQHDRFASIKMRSHSFRLLMAIQLGVFCGGFRFSHVCVDQDQHLSSFGGTAPTRGSFSQWIYANSSQFRPIQWPSFSDLFTTNFSTYHSLCITRTTIFQSATLIQRTQSGIQYF